MIIKISRTYLAVSAVVLAAILFICGLSVKSTGAPFSGNEARLPVAMYHQLTKSESKAGRYSLTLEKFENDLKYLKEKGYETATLQTLFDYVRGKGKMPEKAIMITFDDGWETLYAYALPLLKKYGFTAVAFVVGTFADRYTEADDHNLNYSYLNWSEIKELSEGNIIDVQSHTYDLHRIAAGRSGLKKKKNESDEAYREFLGADASKMREAALKNLGKAPRAIAYPFGSFSARSDEILKDYGIAATFTCTEKVNVIKKYEPESLFGLGRYNRPNGISTESYFGKMGI